jgi:drug/metabolite transporter (DMT)-like permease
MSDARAPELRGPLLMIVASTLFAGMGLLVKLAAMDVPASHIVLWRNVFSVLGMIPLVLRSPAILRPSRFGPLVVRALTGVGSMFCYFTAIDRLPLGDAVMISYASPLVVAMLSPWLTGEPWRRGIWPALLVGFLGVALVADPTLQGDLLGVAAACATAVLAGLAYVYVRIATRTERNDTIVFWFCAISAIVFLPAPWVQPAAYTPTTWLTLAGTGAIGLVAQLAMTRALSMGEASRIALYGYVTPVIAYGAALLVLGEPVGWRGLAGTAMVAVAGLMAARAAPG